MILLFTEVQKGIDESVILLPYKMLAMPHLVTYMQVIPIWSLFISLSLTKEKQKNIKNVKQYYIFHKDCRLFIVVHFYSFYSSLCKFTSNCTVFGLLLGEHFGWILNYLRLGWLRFYFKQCVCNLNSMGYLKIKQLILVCFTFFLAKDAQGIFDVA